MYDILTANGSPALKRGDEDADGNTIVYQCPRCGNAERFRTLMVGLFDLDGAGCWDIYTKDTGLKVLGGREDGYMICLECDFLDAPEVFTGEMTPPEAITLGKGASHA